MPGLVVVLAAVTALMGAFLVVVVKALPLLRGLSAAEPAVRKPVDDPAYLAEKSRQETSLASLRATAEEATAAVDEARAAAAAARTEAAAAKAEASAARPAGRRARAGAAHLGGQGTGAGQRAAPATPGRARAAAGRGGRAPRRAGPADHHRRVRPGGTGRVAQRARDRARRSRGVPAA